MDQRIPDGVRDLRAWTFREVYEAHVVLDALDDAAEIMRPDPPPDR